MSTFEALCYRKENGDTKKSAQIFLFSICDFAFLSYYFFLHGARKAFHSEISSFNIAPGKKKLCINFAMTTTKERNLNIENKNQISNKDTKRKNKK